MIPMPPIQWLNDLHRIMLLGVLAKSVITVAPVVVKPEADSNTALARSGVAFVRRKGIVPQAIIRIQDRPTSRKPSLLERPGRSSSA